MSKNDFLKLIHIIVTDEKIELEWFYYSGSTEWTGVSFVETSLPVAPWANKTAVEDALRSWAQNSNVQSPIRGFQLNEKDWACLAQCGRI